MSVTFRLYLVYFLIHGRAVLCCHWRCPSASNNPVNTESLHKWKLFENCFSFSVHFSVLFPSISVWTLHMCKLVIIQALDITKSLWSLLPCSKLSHFCNNAFCKCSSRTGSIAGKDTCFTSPLILQFWNYVCFTRTRFYFKKA